jgi:hypothetical protein
LGPLFFPLCEMAETAALVIEYGIITLTKSNGLVKGTAIDNGTGRPRVYQVIRKRRTRTKSWASPITPQKLHCLPP